MPAELPLAIFAHVPECLFAIGLIAVATSDLRDRRIPNGLLLPLTACGLANRLAAGSFGLGIGVAGIGVGSVALLYPFWRGLVGGGDVKLLGTIGAWMGPFATIQVLVVGLVVCGALSLAIALSQRELRRDATTFFGLLAAGVTPNVEPRSPHFTAPLGAAFVGAVPIVVAVRGGL
jgi:prepilin peptidase CpaA